MADDLTQRSFRLSDRPARPKTSSGTDPLAELARLIGQTDPFGEFGREQARTARPGEPAGELRAPRAAAPSAEWSMPPTPAVDWNTPPAPVPGYPPQRVHVPGPAVASMPTFAERAHEDAPHADNDAHEHAGERLAEDASIAPLDGEHDDLYEHEEPRRRTGMIAIAAVLALAVIGTAGAFGYRALFGNSGAVLPVIKADPTPIKVEATKNPSIKTTQERVPGPGEKLVSREEKPIELKDKPAGAIPPAAAAPVAPGAISTEPKKIHTIAIRPDGAMVDPGVAPSAPPASAAPPAARVPTPPSRPPVAEPPQQRVVQAAPRNGGPLSLNPNAAPAPPAARPAPAPAAPPSAAPPAEAAPPAAAPVAASGYAVQVSSQRSEAEAQAAFRTLQAKFPGQLGTQQAMIRRVELGEKGVYFRAMVGPFGSSDEAIKLCTSLKSAGGSCIVQKI